MESSGAKPIHLKRLLLPLLQCSVRRAPVQPAGRQAPDPACGFMNGKLFYKTKSAVNSPLSICPQLRAPTTRRGTVRDLKMISNERKNMWQASNPCTRLEYAMPENQPLVQNFRFTGKSVSSDSIRACSHKVLSPPISHATSLPAQCRRSRAPVRRAACCREAGGFGFDKTAMATGAGGDDPCHATPYSRRHAIKKWLVSSTKRRKEGGRKKWGRRKQKVFCSSDRRKTNAASPSS